MGSILLGPAKSLEGVLLVGNLLKHQSDLSSYLCHWDSPMVFWNPREMILEIVVRTMSLFPFLKRAEGI